MAEKLMYLVFFSGNAYKSIEILGYVMLITARVCSLRKVKKRVDKCIDIECIVVDVVNCY